MSGEAGFETFYHAGLQKHGSKDLAPVARTSRFAASRFLVT